MTRGRRVKGWCLEVILRFVPIFPHFRAMLVTGSLMAGSMGNGGCAPGAAPDEATLRSYAALLRLEDPSKGDLDACHDLSDPQLAGDCGLALASRLRFTSRTPLADSCPDIRKGMWQDECWFMAAEDAMGQNVPAEAARLCRKSGRFQEDCGQHLWQRPLRALVGNIAASELQQNLPAVRRLHDEWHPLVSGFTDFDTRFWQRYYQNALERLPRISMESCDPLDDEDRDRCRLAARDIFFRRLAESLHAPEVRDRFCALAADGTDASEMVALRLDLAAPADPLLDEVVRRRAKDICP